MSIDGACAPWVYRTEGKTPRCLPDKCMPVAEHNSDTVFSESPPMPKRNILSVYDDMLQVSHQMVEAAQRQDWDALNELEAVCATYVKQIQVAKRQTELGSQEIETKVAYLMKILADDRRIRDLSEPWMVELAKMMAPRSRTRPSAPNRD
ncbi:protein FliT [Jezberella montanilacus]|uniref:Flagellar protein FliT n=2 Tax=Jezberella montanilacus TaxID=323426 RepID=A0A2T0XD85_9BURK|nr:protein FliT [Jezberella montanilacus]